MNTRKCPALLGGGGPGGEAAAEATSSSIVAPATFHLSDLEAADYNVRHDATRRAWALVSRLDHDRATKLYHRYASDPPGSPEWKIAELSRLRVYQIGRYRPIEALDACPRHGEIGRWWISVAGELVCVCAVQS